MKVSTTDPGMAQFMRMNGAVFINYDPESGYNFDSDKKRNEWRSAYLATAYPEHTAGVSQLINLKKEAD